MVTALQGKRALVTGAASGIGRAIATALGEAGARVAGMDLVTAKSAPYPMIISDVADEAAVRNGVGYALDELGGLDVLCNAAGIEKGTQLSELDMAIVQRMFAVNVFGTMHVTKAALPHLSDGGRVINIASELAYLGRAGTSAYCATKGAILSLTRSWARELGPRILVNAVAPGPTDTPLLDFGNMSPELQALELSNPLGRIGQPEEIAAVVVFLAGPGATFITGQCLGVDGGAAMH
jgi:3-oxoacyl-[acyl-carrier protein] reductase